MISKESCVCGVFRFEWVLVSPPVKCMRTHGEDWGLMLELSRRGVCVWFKWLRRCIAYTSCEPPKMVGLVHGSHSGNDSGSEHSSFFVWTRDLDLP